MGTKERVQRLWAQQTITARDVYDTFPLSCPVVFGPEQPPLIYDQLLAEKAPFPPHWGPILDAHRVLMLQQAVLNAAWLNRMTKEMLG